MPIILNRSEKRVCLFHHPDEITYVNLNYENFYHEYYHLNVEVGN